MTRMRLSAARGACSQVGCGNSELAVSMHGEGFAKVWSIDCSRTVIDQMKAAHAEYKGLTVRSAAA